jgi:hypothetical protein
MNDDDVVVRRVWDLESSSLWCAVDMAGIVSRVGGDEGAQGTHLHV